MKKLVKPINYSYEYIQYNDNSEEISEFIGENATITPRKDGGLGIVCGNNLIGNISVYFIENGDYVVKSIVTDDVFTLSQESMHKLFRKQYDERG